MEQEMRISSAFVRRLRNERGWSQDQLATVSGLSLRTIQRVEAHGTASMATKVSLAATFGIHQSQLSEVAASVQVNVSDETQRLGSLFLGIAILTCVVIGEAGRFPGSPSSDVFAALGAVLLILGALLGVPPAIGLIVRRHYAAVGLAILGTPLLILLAGGMAFAIGQGHAPRWPLVAFGIGGAALMAMALRQLMHDRQLSARV
jgi:transcriptional regulator with XRE-family HTH domain